MAQTKTKQTKKTAKNAATSNSTKRTSSSQGKTEAHLRDPKVIAVDTSYAFVGLGTDAVRVARTLPERAKTLRDIDGRRADVEKRVRDIRGRVEQRFDEKATEGRTVVDDMLKQPQVRSVVDQAKTARTQVKAAITSIRKTATQTVNAGVEAGRKQAGTARTQAKAASTSVKKTAEAAVEATKDLVNNDTSTERNSDS